MLCFGGNTSVLKSDFYPPLDTSSGEWEIGLISFTSCNSIPNVEMNYNNKFYYAPKITHVFKKKGAKADAAEEEDDPSLKHHEIIDDRSAILNQWYKVLLKAKQTSAGGDIDYEDNSITDSRRTARATTAAPRYKILEFVSLPEGSFEFQTIANLLTSRLHDRNIKLQMAVDPSTLKCSVLSNAKLDFTKPESIGSLLGFNNTRIIEADTEAKGDTAVQISRPNVIRVKCNVVSGSYSNGVKDHVIYEFYPNVDPGYKIVVTVQNVIYLPVDAEQIGNITLEVVDENGRLINNRGEEINITLHLRQRK